MSRINNDKSGTRRLLRGSLIIRNLWRSGSRSTRQLPRRSYYLRGAFPAEPRGLQLYQGIDPRRTFLKLEPCQSYALGPTLRQHGTEA
jgi:hypothetical protein